MKDFPREYYYSFNLSLQHPTKAGYPLTSI